MRHKKTLIGIVSSIMVLGIGICARNTSADLIRSDFASGELVRLCEQGLQQTLARLDGIAKLGPSERTFDNTVLEFENANADLADKTLPLSFMKYVSPNKMINAEGAKCEQLVGDFSAKTFGRRDLYLALKNMSPRNEDETRLLKKTLEAFEANGLNLSDEKLAKVTDLFFKLNHLQTEYSDNMNGDSTTVEFFAEELTGVSADFLARLKKTSDGKRFVVSTRITDYEEVMQKAKNEATRKKMLSAYTNRQGVANTKLLEDAILVREQIATLMGYETWADYQLSHGRMAKSSQSVLQFLGGLTTKLSKRNSQDMAQLLEFKKSLDSDATEVKAWDILYLSYQLKKLNYTLDDDQIREYFPSDTVVQGLFKVYSQLLGVRFEEVKGAHTWSPDVKLYQIVNQKDDRFIGHFYMDFIPRQGKYEHFAAFQIINARILPSGYNHPVSAIVGNFNPPSNGKPSLLNHEEVVTVFHEFGHIMHQTLTRAPYSSLSGSAVAQDFVEAPSQMLENWPWESKILSLVSGHYLDPSKKLPEDLLRKMLDARDFQQGYHYTRQLLLAQTDMAYHTAKGPVDTASVYNKLHKEILGLDALEGGHFAASFGHLMGGYDAGYYGYLWSEVYAADMFTRFKTTDVLSPETGSAYRTTVLERGNMEDAQDLLTRFLGRSSNNAAFLKKLHIE